MQNGGDGPNACHVRVKWVKRTRFLSPRVTACASFVSLLAWYFFFWEWAGVVLSRRKFYHHKSTSFTSYNTRAHQRRLNQNKPPFITATFVTCEIIIMTVCDYMNLSWMRLRNKNGSSLNRHVYFELNGCVDGLAKRGQERSRAWNNMII